MRDMAGAGTRAFDGIICIGGEDWWYHNRGHFDLQIMRRFARHMPVLFVNSLGVRMPHLGGQAGTNKQFVEKISRKLKSLSNGLVNVENKFWVFSPVMVPGAAGQALSSWALAPQIKLAARRAGIVNPLLWVHCPPGARLVDEIDAAAIVMQRTDRFEAFPEAKGRGIADDVATLKRRADLVVYCAPHLLAEEKGAVKQQLLVTHGVDLETFIAAGDAIGHEPDDMRALARPRAGFIGGIDAHTFDPALFIAVATLLPDVTFPLIGSCSLPEGWCAETPNVVLLGRKPYEQVAHYMAAMDVLLMPWNDSDWIRACNPIKLKEYLAVGRPVVTTDFPALDEWRDLVRVAGTPETFAAAIRQALAAKLDPAIARQRLVVETWDAKADLIQFAIDDIVAARTSPAAGRSVA